MRILTCYPMLIIQVRIDLWDLHCIEVLKLKH
jgi:hypothetical protein